MPLVEQYQLFYATILTLLTLFLLGAARIKVTGQTILRSGFEMVFVGGMAAASAYFIGYAVSLIV